MGMNGINLTHLVIIFFIAISSDAIAQVFRGKVFDKKSKTPLPYASLGIRGKSIGGIADESGAFSINLIDAKPTDVIVISYIGYQTVTFKVENLTIEKSQEIYLEPKTIELREVMVFDKRQIIVLGNNKKESRSTGWGADESSKGRSRGLKIENNKRIKLTQFAVYVNKNTFDSVRLRLNIYEENANVDSNESQLLNENIFFTVSHGRKWAYVNLDRFDITTSVSIVVTVEWVDAWDANPEHFLNSTTKEKAQQHFLTYGMTKNNGIYYTRETPQEKFQKNTTMGTPAMYVECFEW
jgi:hypothetical protein